jgi:hypothetical protein
LNKLVYPPQRPAIDALALAVYFFKPCDRGHRQRGQASNNLAHGRKSIQRLEDDMREIITATAILVTATVTTALALSPTSTINALLGRWVVPIHSPLLW